MDHIAGFRRALRDELEAVRERPRDELPLTDGRRLGRVSGSWRYRFNATVELRAPPDSPGRLTAAGARHDCALLAVEGHEVVIGIEVDLGAVVRQASLAVDASFLIERLLARIEDLRDLPNAAGDQALGLRPVTGHPLPATSDLLNREQVAAVESALGRSCTFLWGPPGTGKTHTIGAIANALRDRGQRTLIVSHTNVAVDHAVLAAAAGSGDRPSTTSLLRVGVPRDQRLVKRPELLAYHHLRLRQKPLADQLKAIKASLRTAQQRLSDLDRASALRGWLKDAAREHRWLATEQLALRHHESKQERTTTDAVVAAARALQERQRALRANARKLNDFAQRAREAGREELADAALSQQRRDTAQLHADCAVFRERHDRQHDDLLAHYDSPAARSKREESTRKLRERHAEFRRRIDTLLDVPTVHGIIPTTQPDDDDSASHVASLIATVEAELAGYAEIDVAVETATAASTVRELETDVTRIEEALQRLESELLAGADIVGATLTAGFARRALLESHFDVIIIDEASMAQLPAVWCCAASADRAVVVGDFRQLAPVVIADTPAAAKWLVRDTFEAAGIVDAVDRGDASPGLVALTEQRRMSPDISWLTNRLAYRGLLTDADGVEDEAELEDWLAAGPWQGAPVLTVDTEPFGSFASTARGSAGWSRANVVTGTISVALARAMLADERPSAQPGAPPRILIITPYRPQADLLQSMLIAEGLAGEVTAGTVHSFQGSEASVVILDLTAARPHHRIGLLSAANDDGNRRLLNVAVTRARRRLVAVGDLAWLLKQASPQGAAHGLLRDVLSTSVAIDIKQFLREHRTLAGTTSGLWIANSEDPGAGIREALQHAKSSVVIYTPRINDSGIDEWGALLQRRHREIEVLVVTGEPDTELNRRGHKRLIESGFPPILKQNMRERAIVIDGSRVALLDHHPLVGTTRGTILWWNDRRAAQHLDRTIGAGRLVRELQRGGGGCRRCALPLSLAEGDHRDPGPYWRCPRCGRTRRPSEVA